MSNDNWDGFPPPHDFKQEELSFENNEHINK